MATTEFILDVAAVSCVVNINASFVENENKSNSVRPHKYQYYTMCYFMFSELQDTTPYQYITTLLEQVPSSVDPFSGLQYPIYN